MFREKDVVTVLSAAFHIGLVPLNVEITNVHTLQKQIRFVS